MADAALPYRSDRHQKAAIRCGLLFYRFRRTSQPVLCFYAARPLHTLTFVNDGLSAIWRIRTTNDRQDGADMSSAFQFRAAASVATVRPPVQAGGAGAIPAWNTSASFVQEIGCAHARRCAGSSPRQAVGDTGGHLRIASRKGWP